MQLYHTTHDNTFSLTYFTFDSNISIVYINANQLFVKLRRYTLRILRIFRETRWKLCNSYRSFATPLVGQYRILRFLLGLAKTHFLSCIYTRENGNLLVSLYKPSIHRKRNRKWDCVGRSILDYSVFLYAVGGHFKLL